jgi:UDP-glucose 4-epimerase
VTTTETVCVLGASGFIGSNLCSALVREFHIVRGFGRRPAPASLASIEWHQGDLADSEAVTRVVRGCGVVFHLVCSTVPGSSDPVFDNRTNVVPTIKLLEICRQVGVRRIIFISSGGTVYGPASEVPIREDAPTNPICPYGIGKLACEKYLLLYRRLHGVDARILRVSNVYGPFQTATQQGIVGIFLRQALENKPIEIWGGGKSIRDYLYIDDLIRAFILAAQRPEWPSILNIGSGKGLSTLEVADSIEALLGRSLRRIERPGRASDVSVNVLDIGAAARLGWAPHTDFASGLASTRDWLTCRGVHGARVLT